MHHSLEFTVFEPGDYAEYKSWFENEIIKSALYEIDEEWLDFVKNDDTGFEGGLNIYRAGAKAGMQWLMGKKENFIIDLAFGGKYSDFNLNVKEGTGESFDNEDLFQGFSPELHFAIGFAF